MSFIPFKPSRALPSLSGSIVEIDFPPSCESTVSIITLNAPSKLNAVRRRDAQAISDLLNWISEQSQLSITILTAKGRFFSAGADFKDTSRHPPKEILELSEDDPRKHSGMHHFYKSNLATANSALAQALISHRPLLVGAIPGPAVGMMASILGHFDLLYSYENFWISTPFSSLGLVAEGLSSMTFARKLGLGLAQEALLSGRRISAEELASKGFVTKLFKAPTGLKDENHTLPILEETLRLVKETYIPPKVNSWALLKSKELIKRATYEPMGMEAGNAEEIKAALEVSMSGIPSRQIKAMAEAKRRQKL